MARAGGDSFGGAEVGEGLGVGLKSATLEVMNLASRRAFTLIELMIVVAIIGLLAALAIPNFMKFQARSRQAEVRSGLRAVFTAQKSYYGNQQTYYDEFDVIGFEPEGGNRYQYFLGGGGLETRACGVAPVCAAGASAICVNGPKGCGTIQSDQKWTNCAAQAVTAVPVSGGVAGPDGIAQPAAASAVPLGSCCNAGQCEFVATAYGNVDNDPAIDQWFIGSFQSNAAAGAAVSGVNCGGAAGTTGLFAEGEGVNVCNDVNF